MSMSEERSFGTEDEVLVLRLYAGDEACSEYGFKLEGKFPNDSAIHLEQLNVLQSILSKHVENAERAVIHKTITDGRSARMAGAKVKNNILKFPEPTGQPS
jgi:hypothetical protein